MSYPTTRTHHRTLAAAFPCERAWCIEGPRGDRMALRIRTRPGLFLRIWRWLRGEA